MRVLLLALLACSSSSLACSLDSPTARLPGFSDKQAEERAHKLWSDWKVIGHYQRTKALIEEAPTIYLARVTKIDKASEKFRSLATIEPLQAIKGELPSEGKVLEGFLPDSCDGANGDGDGVYTRAGELIIVFEGVSRRQNRPNGIDSVLVTETRNLKLLDAVQAWLSTLPGYQPYD